MSEAVFAVAVAETCVFAGLDVPAIFLHADNGATVTTQDTLFVVCDASPRVPAAVELH